MPARLLQILGLLTTLVVLAAADTERPETPEVDLKNLELYEVSRVVDGDTVRVLINDENLSVRIIGLDTPETVHPSKPVERFGLEASEHAKELLEGKSVYLAPDQGETLAKDRYGRLLAHVWTEDGKLFALEMISDGYAHYYGKYPFREDYMELLRAAEKYAREHELGLWAEE